MKNIVIVSIIVSLVLIGVIYGYVGDIIGDDMVNILSMLAAILILGITVGVGLKYVNQMKNDKATGTLADENWDGIGEYKNPLPIGWAVSFIGTMIFFVWYNLVGYPTWAYSQIGEYNEEVAAHNAKFEEIHKDAGEEELNAMGESVFLVNCAPCHGVTGDGMDGKAADLTRRLDYSAVLHTINNGSNNNLIGPGSMMPSYSWLSQAEKVSIAKYVADGFNGENVGFATHCAACHGANGKGMAYVAPNINHFTPDLVKAVLENGKKGAIGTMPAFKVEEMRLTETQQKAVGTYISNLSAN
jgi:cytochrome c oxidase cbb3-type subunit 3